MAISTPNLDLDVDVSQLPAFPVPHGAEGGVAFRDWLAATALNGLASKGLEVKADRAMTQHEKNLEMAKQAYALADAMLEARTL